MIENIKSWLQVENYKQFEILSRNDSIVESVLRISTQQVFKVDIPYDLPNAKAAGFFRGEIIFDKFYEDCVYVNVTIRYYSKDGLVSESSYFNNELESFTSNIGNAVGAMI